MKTEEAQEVLSQKVKQAQDLIQECKEFADEHSLHFDLSLGQAGNVDREIGGRYVGKGNTDHYGLYNWEGSEEVEYQSGDHEGFWDAWQSSSESC